VKNINTGKERTIHFGGKGYEQFKDSTGLGHYSHVNHGTLKRKKNYFSRHSGEKTKNKAVVKELKKSKGCYNAKILSHTTLLYIVFQIIIPYYVDINKIKTFNDQLLIQSNMSINT